MAAPAPDFLSKAGIFFLKRLRLFYFILCLGVGLKGPRVTSFTVPLILYLSVGLNEAAEGDLLYCPIDPIP